MAKYNIKNISIFFFLLVSQYSYSQIDSIHYVQADSISDLVYNVNPQPIVANRLHILPFRSVNGIALTNPGTYLLKYNNLVIDGLNATSEYVFIEGMQVTDGAEFPFRAISQYQLFRSNQPIHYGNVAGSMIELETPVYVDKFHFDLDGYTNLDKKNNTAYENTAIEINMGGPIRFNSKKKKSKLAPLFYLGLNYTYTNDPYPSWEKKYRATSETMDFLTENPLRPTGLQQGGTYLNAKFVDESDFTEVKSHQDAQRNKWNTFLKLIFPINRNINLTLGSYSKFDNGSEFMFKNALFNSQNNPETYFRNFDNYLKFDHKIYLNEDLSIDYTVHFQYSNYYFRRWDASHKDRYFEYGYLGKYKTYKTPTYELGDIEIDGQLYENVWLLNSWDYDTAYTFQNLDYNPELARYTEQIYEIYPESEGHWMNSDQLRLQGGFLNGIDRQMMVYGLWSGHGINTPYASKPMMTLTGVNNRAGESRNNKYRGTFYANVNYKNHKITAGFEYMQKVERYYFIDPHKLWNNMRNMSNFHLKQLDLTNPEAIFENGIFQDSVLFFRNYDASSQFEFDKRLRQELGFSIDGLEYILIDSYDMRNNTIDYYDQYGTMHTKQLSSDLLSLGLFSTSELVNSRMVNNKGFDVYGNKMSGKTGKYDYFYNGQSDAFRPIYNAFYINDEFNWRFLDVSVGLRLDRYNANQPVLKDKYSLYEIFTAGQINSIDGNPVTHPSAIQDDYKVYVDDIYNPSSIVGYRSDDQWFDKYGDEIQNPSELDAGSGISPYLVDPDVEIGDAEWNPDMTFTDYKPVINFLPQININVNTKYGNIYFHYNSFTQNPTQYHDFKPDKYLFYETSIFRLENPSLEPIRTDKIIGGIRPRIYKGLFADISYMWTILNNVNYIDRVNWAYPRPYLIMSNRKEEVKNQGIIASLNYQRPGNSGLSGSISYARYFIKEEDLIYQNTSDLIINSFVSYDFGYGRNFVLNDNKVLRSIFELLNVGIYYQFRSGLYIRGIASIFPNYPNYNYGNFNYKYTPDVSF
ncbi:MAG: hypothetical protein K8R74_05790, partial [Bacteroidales bacterium]|nr:hypothetical protein [Bacteroidales bacterium]